MKKTLILLLTLVPGASATMAQDLNPGVDRWSIKTSVISNPRKKNSTIDDLLSLPDPITKSKQAPGDARIAKTVNGLKEGDMVTITGWLHLVALEDDSKKHRDGDYHIQIRNGSEWADTCLVVEVPFPDFIDDAALKSKCSAARQFVLTKLLKSKEPSTGGNKMTHPVFVKITGQLFFDATHLGGKPRGKRAMHSYTCWELHPVTSIAFAPKPPSN